MQLGIHQWLVVNKRSHPAIPDIEERAKVTPHVGVMVIVMRHVVKAFEQPVLGLSLIHI